MKRGNRQTFIIDFDSTFVQVEALDELANIVLEKSPIKNEVIREVKKLTNLGMAGKISFEESLKRRFELFKPDNGHLRKLTALLKNKITPSFARNRDFFRKHSNDIYIISGGFKEWILPVVKGFGIKEKNILANNFTFNGAGDITGYDKKNELARAKGKIRKIKKLGLGGDVFVIGDGYTDLEVKSEGCATKFFVFTENSERKEAIKFADYILPNFDELLYILDLPRALSFPKNRIKVLLLEDVHRSALDLLGREGYTIKYLPHAPSEDELIGEMKDVSILGIRSKTKLSKRVIQNSPRLLCVGAFCIGTNQVDVLHCARHGIPVFNAPYSNTRSVAELVIGELIILNRKVIEKSAKMHGGIWRKDSHGSHEVRGKTLGIIGYGNIGSQVSVLAESLGMNVHFYDIEEKLPLGNAVRCGSLKALLETSDFITVHVDGREENRNLIGENEFSAMKQGAVFLNLSRGFVVDIKALVKYIKNEKLKGVAVDVFPKEPKSNDEEFRSALKSLPNVILTPHIGGSTQEAQENIGKFVSNKLISFVNSGDTTLGINFPNASLSKTESSHRLIHIHKNEPGVIAGINEILARYEINVEGQGLKTNEEVGYAIIDINKKYNAGLIEEIRSVPATIKLRVIF